MSSNHETPTGAAPTETGPTAAELKAATKLQAAERGRAARKKSKSLLDAANFAEAKELATVEVLQIKDEILAGQDGLGAIAGAASRQHPCVDATLHMFNNIGFAWADRHRIKVMVSIICLGAVCFASAVCGAQGLSPHSMSTLPWAVMTEANVSAYDFLWWAYGPAGVASNANATGNAVAAHFYGRSNEALWQAFPTGPAAHFAAVNVSTPFAESGIAHVPSPFAGRWAFNQWGVCLFPSEQWAFDALAAGAAAPFVATAESGICRPWSSFDQTWARAAYMDCKKPGVDGFSLVMGAFGGFMKMIEPIPRMKRATDGHQKTLVLLIILISSIPALLGILNFSCGCFAALETMESAERTEYGAGMLLFTLSVAILLPIFLLHLMVPAAVTTALERAASGDSTGKAEAAKSPCKSPGATACATDAKQVEVVVVGGA